MTLEQFTRNEGQLARQYEYDDGSVLAVDFGTAVEASADLVDDTVIVVVEGSDRTTAGPSDGNEPSQETEQYEFELPDGADDAHTFMKNGVLTVEMEGNL